MIALEETDMISDHILITVFGAVEIDHDLGEGSKERKEIENVCNINLTLSGDLRFNIGRLQSVVIVKNRYILIVK